MLVRIDTISRVGRFQRFHAPSVQLGHFTLIYGENTTGKSTLADILHSLEVQDPIPVLSRRTIPADKSSIRVKLNFAGRSGSEEIVEFKNDQWCGAVPHGMALRVFDDGFLHRNLFTGRSASRENKVALTKFVLGAEGVALNDQIAFLKQRAEHGQRRLATLRTDVFTGIADILGFVHLEITESEPEFRAKQEQLNERLMDLRGRHKNASEIAARPIVTTVVWTWGPGGLLTRLNEIFSFTMETVHCDARSRLEEHLAAHLRHAATGELWLRQGLDHIKNDVCPFCGQQLSQNARGLLDAYSAVFNDTYRKWEAKATQDLSAVIGEFRTDQTAVVLKLLDKNRLTLEKYRDLRAEAGHEAVFIAFEEATERVCRHAEVLRLILARTAEEVDVLRQKKLLQLHKAIAPYAGKELREAYEALRLAIEKYNEAVATVSTAMQHFKERNQFAPLEDAAAEVESKLVDIRLKLRRLKLADQCVEYTNVDARVISDLDSVSELRAKLAEQQSEFLSTYFERLNGLFVRFGSGDFTLERNTDFRGHRPVISLSVRLSGQIVPESTLERVFSESDRRALALAVYWAQVSGMSSAEKRRTILVLDDHVTSFDEHRIGCVHRTVAEVAKDFRQVILIGHYRSSFARFIRCYGELLSPIVLRLGRTRGGPKLSCWNADGLLDDEHTRIASELFDFIDELGSNPGADKLRVFLEHEISDRFREQMRREGISEQQLSRRIDLMADCGIISDILRKKLHIWRATLNPEHHIWTASTVEDQRQTASDFVRFIYDELYPYLPPAVIV